MAVSFPEKQSPSFYYSTGAHPQQLAEGQMESWVYIWPDFEGNFNEFCLQQNTGSSQAENTREQINQQAEFLQPVQIRSFVAISSLSCGEYLAAFVTTNGSLYCWNWENTDKKIFENRSPHLVDNDEFNQKIIVKVSCGSRHLACLSELGEVFAMGKGLNYSASDQLQKKTSHSANNNVQAEDFSLLPFEVTLPERASEVSSGPDYILIMTVSGNVFGIGRAGIKALGKQKVNQNLFKIAFPKQEKMISISAGSQHALGISDEGQVFAWGSNKHGELGARNPSPKDVPIEVQEISKKKIVKIAASDYSVAMSDSNEIYIWGHKRYLMVTMIANVNAKQILPAEKALIFVNSEELQLLDLEKLIGAESSSQKKNSSIVISIPHLAEVSKCKERLIAISTKLGNLESIFHKECAKEKLQDKTKEQRRQFSAAIQHENNFCNGIISPEEENSQNSTLPSTVINEVAINSKRITMNYSNADISTETFKENSLSPSAKLRPLNYYEDNATKRLTRNDDKRNVRTSGVNENENFPGEQLMEQKSKPRGLPFRDLQEGNYENFRILKNSLNNEFSLKTRRSYEPDIVASEFPYATKLLPYKEVSKAAKTPDEYDMPVPYGFETPAQTFLQTKKQDFSHYANFKSMPPLHPRNFSEIDLAEDYLYANPLNNSMPLGSSKRATSLNVLPGLDMDKDNRNFSMLAQKSAEFPSGLQAAHGLVNREITNGSYGYTTALGKIFPAASYKDLNFLRLEEKEAATQAKLTKLQQDFWHVQQQFHQTSEDNTRLKKELEDEAEQYHSSLFQIVEKYKEIEHTKYMLELKFQEKEESITGLKSCLEAKQELLVELKKDLEESIAKKDNIKKEAKSAIMEWQIAYDVVEKAYNELSKQHQILKETDLKRRTEDGGLKTLSSLDIQTEENTKKESQGESGDKVLQRQIEELVSENLDLKRQLEERTCTFEAHKANDRAEANTLEWKSKAEDFEKQYMKIRDQAMSLQTRVKELEDHNLQKDLELGQKESESKILQAQLKAIEETSSALKNELERQQKQLKNSLEEKDDTIKKMQEQALELEKNANLVSEQIFELHEEFEATKSEATESKTLLAELEGKHQSDTEQYEERIQLLKDQNNNLLQQMSRQSLDLAEYHTDLEKKIFDLEATNEEFNRILQVLRKHDLLPLSAIDKEVNLKDNDKTKNPERIAQILDFTLQEFSSMAFHRESESRMNSILQLEEKKRVDMNLKEQSAKNSEKFEDLKNKLQLSETMYQELQKEAAMIIKVSKEQQGTLEATIKHKEDYIKTLQQAMAGAHNEISGLSRETNGQRKEYQSSSKDNAPEKKGYVRNTTLKACCQHPQRGKCTRKSLSCKPMTKTGFNITTQYPNSDMAANSPPVGFRHVKDSRLHDAVNDSKVARISPREILASKSALQNSIRTKDRLNEFETRKQNVMAQECQEAYVFNPPETQGMYEIPSNSKGKRGALTDTAGGWIATHSSFELMPNSKTQHMDHSMLQKQANISSSVLSLPTVEDISDSEFLNHDTSGTTRDGSFENHTKLIESSDTVKRDYHTKWFGASEDAFQNDEGFNSEARKSSALQNFTKSAFVSTASGNILNNCKFTTNDPALENFLTTKANSNDNTLLKLYAKVAEKLARNTQSTAGSQGQQTLPGECLT